MKKNTRRKYLIPAVACLVVMAGFVYSYFFASMAAGNETRYVYIDTDDTVDSVYTKLADVSSLNGMEGFKTLVRHSHYADNIRTGRYAIKPGEGAFTVFRHMKNGLQSPVSLTVPSVRTLDRHGSFSASVQHPHCCLAGHGRGGGMGVEGFPFLS